MGSGDFDGNMVRSGHAGKVFSLIPFMIESYMTDKNFVLRMELYPKAEYLKMDVLRLSGVETFHVPVN